MPYPPPSERGQRMSDRQTRVTVSLPAAEHAKLQRLAAHTGTTEQADAEARLPQAIDDADPDPAAIIELLRRIPGARDGIDGGIADARAGRIVPADEQ